MQGQHVALQEIVKVERIHKLENAKGPTCAFCDISIMDTFMVRGLRIVEGKGGAFLAMPSEQGKDGRWYNTFYPVTNALKDEMQQIVLAAFYESK